MNLILIILASIGLLWLYISIEKGIKKLKEKGIKEGIKNNIHLKDSMISFIVIIAGATLFAGVTGLVIGLITSVLISIYIRSKHAIDKKKNIKKIKNGRYNVKHK